MGSFSGHIMITPNTTTMCRLMLGMFLLLQLVSASNTATSLLAMSQTFVEQSRLKAETQELEKTLEDLVQCKNILRDANKNYKTFWNSKIGDFDRAPCENAKANTVDDVKRTLKNPLYEPVRKNRLGFTSVRWGVTTNMVNRALEDELNNIKSPECKYCDRCFRTMQTINKHNKQVKELQNEQLRASPKSFFMDDQTEGLAQSLVECQKNVRLRGEIPCKNNAATTADVVKSNQIEFSARTKNTSDYCSKCIETMNEMHYLTPEGKEWKDIMMGARDY